MTTTRGTAAAPAGRRLAQGILAQILAMVTRIAVQVATLPLLFAFWSSERVGAWMMLFALPAYLALVALGFSGAGGSEALASARGGRMDEARAHFSASRVIATLGTLGLIALFLAALLLFPDAAIAASLEVTSGELQATLAWLAAYVFGTAQMAVLTIPFRVAERYPTHTLFACLAALVEIPVIALCVALDGSFSTLAAGLALTRLACVFLVLLAARRIAPELFGARSISMRASLSRLWLPSLAFMIVPVIFTLNLQGYVLVVGYYFGAAALAAFVATRTLARLIDVGTGVIYAVQFNEAGYLAEESKQSVQRRQLATMTLLVLVVTAGFGVLLMLVGEDLQSLFTAGKTGFDPALAAVLLVAGLLRALSTTPQALIAADNEHGRVVAIHLAGSLLAIALALALAASGAPLPVVAGMLVLAELIHLIANFAAALPRLELTWGGFLRSLHSRQRAEDIVLLVRVVARRN